MTYEVELDVLAPDAVSLEVADGGSVGWDSSEFIEVREIPAERYVGPYTVSPSGAEQVLATDGLLMEDDVTVQAAPLAYETRTVSASGTIEIAPPAGSYGLSGASVTVPAGKVTMRKPTMDEAAGEVRSRADLTTGYVAGGSYGGSALILDKQAGTTITPTESAQVAVEQYRWTTGEVDVAAIPSDYVGSAIDRRDSSDLIATGPTVNVPAGYYAENEGKSIADGSATMPASASGHGTIVGALNNTMNVQGTVTATPTVTAGYVASGTSGSTSVSLQTSVTTLDTATWTPTTSDQTIPAGRYTIGTQTIKGDANLLAENVKAGITLFNIVGTCPTFDALSWLGQEAELVQTYAKESTLLSSTSYNGWTPSTTAKTIKSGASLTAVAIDLEQYDYILRWQFFCEPVYNGSETNTARMVKTAQEMYQAIIRRPNSLANIATLTEAGNACQTINTPSLMEYWNNNSSHTYTWSASYGIYAAATAATFASSTALQTNLTPKRPSISARCSTTYFSTGNAGKVTQASTYLYTQGWLYRIKKSKSLGYNQYTVNVCSLFNDGI